MNRFLGGVLACLIVAASGGLAQGEQCSNAVSHTNSSTQIVFLGTGTPTPSAKRQGPAFVILSGGSTYLFDMGVGVMRQANKYNVNLEMPAAAFLSHLHTDHTLGLSDLMFTPWSGGAGNVPTNSLCLYGPVGLQWMVTNILNAYTQDTCVRNQCERHGSNPYQAPAVTEISLSNTPTGGPTPPPTGGSAPACTACNSCSKGGANCICGANLTSTGRKQIYTDDNVTVYAFLVRHGCWDEALGFRIETFDKKVIVYSGDTRYVQSVGANCKSCDVLIHELWWNQGAVDPKNPNCNNYDQCFHTPKEGLQQVFKDGSPKQLVVVHQVGSGSVTDLGITCPDHTTNCITLANDGDTVTP
jgi:ribonuclease BN (tRNA processing enzyme)